MIAKIVKGRGFRGVLEYNLAQGKGYVIDTNMAGRNPRELAAEFGALRRRRPNLGKAVFHASLSAAPGEKLTDDQWRDIGHRYLHGMGFDDNQYIIIRHTDTEHEHIHIVANRVTFAGGVVSESFDCLKQEKILRKIELEYGLRRVASSSEVKRKAPTRGELERLIRTGKPSIRNRLQQLCDAAANGCHSFTEYVERLKAMNVEIVPTVQMNGTKLTGLLYRLDGEAMKGSDLGRDYTAAGVQKRGITYEKDRDFPTIEQCRQRAAYREFDEPNRNFEASQIANRGGIGIEIGTVVDANGQGHGNVDRRNAEGDRRPKGSHGGHGGVDKRDKENASQQQRSHGDAGKWDAEDASRPQGSDGGNTAGHQKFGEGNTRGDASDTTEAIQPGHSHERGNGVDHRGAIDRDYLDDLDELDNLDELDSWDSPSG